MKGGDKIVILEENGRFYFENSAMPAFKRTEDKTPYWRTLKANGELNAKYPGGVEAQKKMLEKEGHIVIQKGRINIKCCTNAKATEMIIFVEKCLIDNIFHDG